MSHLSAGIFGGVIAIVALSPVIAVGPVIADLGAPAVSAGAGNLAERTLAQDVNRARKGDRLPAGALSRGPKQGIAAVEVVGLDNVAVVYRDRQGRVLFQTDPVSNATIVARGVALPEVTVRESNRAPARALPVEQSNQPAPTSVPTSTMPVGCESAFSAMADRSLARVPARCVSSYDDGRKLAVALN
jgi:hypothetical protein